MKVNSTIIQAILALAVVALYIIHFADKKGGNDHNGGAGTEQDHGPLKIAYVKMDSVLFNYQLATDLNEDFNQKQKAFTEEYGAKRVEFEKQAEEFQQKLQRGGFLNQERALQERDRLLGEEREVQRLDYELSNKLSEMQNKINQQVVDSISNFLKDYNADLKYDFIFNNANLLEGGETFNITGEVIEQLNQRYQKTKK